MGFGLEREADTSRNNPGIETNISMSRAKTRIRCGGVSGVEFLLHIRKEENVISELEIDTSLKDRCNTIVDAQARKAGGIIVGCRESDIVSNTSPQIRAA